MLIRYLLLSFFLIAFSSVVAASPFERDASYQVCFTPGSDCSGVLIEAIDNAVKNIWVQAYSFTSKPIAEALVVAKQRGVTVDVIVDKSTLRDDEKILWLLMRNGIAVWVDEQPAIAHNKVMIMDETRVVTGSFNFTYSAQSRNAENLLVIDDEGLAKKYLHNWTRRQHVSIPLSIDTLNYHQPSFLERWWDEFINWLKSLF